MDLIEMRREFVFFFFPTENRKHGLRYFVLYCFQLILHEMRGGAVNCTLSLLLFTSGRFTPVVKIKSINTVYWRFCLCKTLF